MFTTENLVFAIIITGMVVAFLTALVSAWWHDRKARKLEKRLREIASLREQERLNRLPQLRAKDLLQVPDRFAEKFYGKKEHRGRGIYWTRYNRVVIIDREGNVWISLLTPDVIVSLRRCEFESSELFVPFGGPGESYANEGTAEFGGMSFDIYPLFLKGNNPEANIDEWRRWVAIVKAFDDAYSGFNYQDLVGWVLR